MAEHLQQRLDPYLAILDRLLHHSETILIEGKSYRMKDALYNGFGGPCR